MIHRVAQTSLNPRDAAFMGERTRYLICRDCLGEGYLEDEASGQTEDCSCKGTGARLCMCCPSEDQMAVAVWSERGSREPVCQSCAEEWVGKIEEYDTRAAPEPLPFSVPFKPTSEIRTAPEVIR
jgi:hypothetical protein